MNANRTASPSAEVIDLNAYRAKKRHDEGYAKMVAWLPEMNRLTGGLYNFTADQITKHCENGVCVYRKGGAA